MTSPASTIGLDTVKQSHGHAGVEPVGGSTCQSYLGERSVGNLTIAPTISTAGKYVRSTLTSVQPFGSNER